MIRCDGSIQETTSRECGHRAEMRAQENLFASILNKLRLSEMTDIRPSLYIRRWRRRGVSVLLQVPANRWMTHRSLSTPHTLLPTVYTLPRIWGTILVCAVAVRLVLTLILIPLSKERMEKRESSRGEINVLAQSWGKNEIPGQKRSADQPREYRAPFRLWVIPPSKSPQQLGSCSIWSFFIYILG